MEKMKRYAVYYAPPAGAFADRTAAWLGWDPVAGQAVAQPVLAGLPAPMADLTEDPRKYGFHGTLRAPFRPAEGVGRRQIGAAIAAIAARQAPVLCDGLRLDNLEGFLALTPEGEDGTLLALAAAVVEGTNALRAPLDAADIARRRPERLTQRQRLLLDVWGYPYVFEEFQFHLTLTGRLPEGQAGPVAEAILSHLGPVLPRPFAIRDLCLFGEDEAGRFHLLHRYSLSG